METFINRNEELVLVEKAVDILLEKRRLLRTPIIEFYGIKGIGKTTLLRKAEEKCKARQLPYLWADMDQLSPEYVIAEINKLLATQKPAVVILDSLNQISEEELTAIGNGLNRLLDNSNIFVLLASDRVERFENIPLLAHKLKLVPLKAFDRDACSTYLDGLQNLMNPQLHDLIYEWTRGYPLAVSLMAKTLSNTNVAIHNEEKLRQLLARITREVLDEGLFSTVKDASFYSTVLSLLSLPRHFNFITMQAILDSFAPDHKLPSALSYITLLNEIQKATNILRWNSDRGSYSIDATVRSLFLRTLKVERPQQYRDLHAFMADFNERLAHKTSGTDRVHFLCEYFYHLANSSETLDLHARITRNLERFIQEEGPDSFTLFASEFMQDEELKEALGANTASVLAFINRNQALLRASKHSSACITVSFSL